MISKKIDYIIVGQGLAGTCLAFTLSHYYKRSICVIDKDSGAGSSRIAAGTFNPVSFRTFETTWKAAEFVPFLKGFYSELAKSLKSELIAERPIYKLFKSEDQKSLWLKKSMVESTSEFMEVNIKQSIVGVNGELGFGKVLESGNIHMIKMLTAFRKILTFNHTLLEENFDYSKLEILNNSLKYKDIEANALVFCEGYMAIKNPFFSYLPFRCTKGEVLIIKARDWHPGGIIHNNLNIVPMGDDHFWVGSTFNWDDLNFEKTHLAEKKLLDQLKETLNVEFTVVDHWAGIRPTVKDRRPLLGLHPRIKNLFIFNGLGTRGVMIAPYFADQMAKFMEGTGKLISEVDIKRFNESV